MHDITITYSDDDADPDDVALTIVAITHDQFLENGEEFVGSGNPHLDDTAGTGNTASGTESATVHAAVRGERSGTDVTGRVYTITVECADRLPGGIAPDPTEPDSAGNPNPDGTETVDLTVYIPHDMGSGNGI